MLQILIKMTWIFALFFLPNNFKLKRFFLEVFEEKKEFNKNLIFFFLLDGNTFILTNICMKIKFSI